MAETINEQ